MTTSADTKDAGHTELPGESELPDDYPVYGNYLYVADGRFTGATGTISRFAN